LPAMNPVICPLPARWNATVLRIDVRSISLLKFYNFV